MTKGSELNVSRYVAKTIDTGHFGHVGLCQNKTGLKCPASVVIHSATYLLTISLPDIDNVAMNVYDIKMT